MRLVKLYKAYWVAMEKKKEEEARKQKLLELKPGETIQDASAKGTSGLLDIPHGCLLKRLRPGSRHHGI
ncbi:cya [Symbiodinium necroappetens]|uniref:Cya protein n=1 Tax=Symbiodinium necroappetens TaxID=1628268 RepID=A0A813BB62_9DINO|nr:cya [Symbiodinium necroappetens]